jgi:hypothetical protein
MADARKLPKFGGSPYQYAKELQAAGVSREEMLDLLEDTGLALDQAKVIANSVGVQEAPASRSMRQAMQRSTPAPSRPSIPKAAVERPAPPARQAELGRFSSQHVELARGLKAQGYSGGVVARRLIEEHQMEEEAATALVSKLYGKNINPRGGDTVTAVVIGLGIAAAGAVGLFVLFSLPVPLPRTVKAPILAACLGALGTGVTKVIIALVNAGVKEDLRAR